MCVSGQERYGNMTRVYYREAVGALMVFDVTRASTFDAVLKWKDDLDSKVRPLVKIPPPPLSPPKKGKLKLKLFFLSCHSFRGVEKVTLYLHMSSHDRIHSALF